MKKDMKPILALLVFLLVFSGTVLAGVAEEEEKDKTVVETARRCIQLSRIKDLDIIDDQTILFRMLNNKIWKNTLPYRCHGLSFEKGIMYRTSLDMLCNVDIITVLNYGTKCGLGMFEPYDKTAEKKDDKKKGDS